MFLIPGNFAEWRNNVSYATFPDWRAAGGGLLANTGTREMERDEMLVEDKRMEEREVVGRREWRKRRGWKSLSGMQLGQHHPHKHSFSLPVHLISSSGSPSSWHFMRRPFFISLFSAQLPSFLVFDRPSHIHTRTYEHMNTYVRIFHYNSRQRLSTYAPDNDITAEGIA